MLYAYLLMLAGLLADYITTQQGLARGAKEGGPVKSAWGRAIVFAVIAGAMAGSCWGPDGWRWYPVANVALCLGIAATRFYAAAHNRKAARG